MQILSPLLMQNHDYNADSSIQRKDFWTHSSQYNEEEVEGVVLELVLRQGMFIPGTLLGG